MYVLDMNINLRKFYFRSPRWKHCLNVTERTSAHWAVPCGVTVMPVSELLTVRSVTVCEGFVCPLIRASAGKDHAKFLPS